MIYLYLGDESLAAVQTTKRVLGGEKIISSSRKEIEEGIIVNGLIVEKEKLREELNNLFGLGYPKAIKDPFLSLAVSDKQVFTQRGNLPPLDGQSTSDLILSEVKKLLPYDPVELENFYKTIEISSSQKEYFYTAIGKVTILHFADFFAEMGLRLSFLGSQSLALFELIKPEIGEREKVVYFEVEGKALEYFVFDRYSPVVVGDKKHSSKLTHTSIREIVKKLGEEKGFRFQKIFIGGPKSLEIHATEISEEVEIPAIKIGEVMDSLLLKDKVEIDTGGIPKMFFGSALGLLLLSSSSSPPNFAADLSQIEKVASRSEEIKEGRKAPIEKEERPAEKEVKERLETQFLIGETIEGRKSKKIYLLTGFIIAFVLFLLAIFALSKPRGIALPFLSSPTPTPTQTLVPTLTPTPTIDPKLKRSSLVVKVENGTDKTGFAKETAEFLESKGYKNVAKSNADRDDYEKTIIKVKKEKRNYSPLIMSDLRDKFDTLTVEDLEEEEKFDVIIILGKK